jgi:uncharacterized protein (TIGR02453 family)
VVEHFTRESLSFLRDLAKHNDRAWFLRNKARYEEHVKAPAEAFAGAVAAKLALEPHVMRIHRDVRFSKDKSPYKTAAAAVTESQGGAAYYVQISALGLYVGSGYYMLAPDQLERYRAAVADGKKGPQLATAVDALRAQKYNVDSREALKRVPRGFDADHPRAELLKRKGMHVGREFGAPKWMHTAGAAERIVKAWRDAAPVNRWLDRNVGPSTLPPPEPE